MITWLRRMASKSIIESVNCNIFFSMDLITQCLKIALKVSCFHFCESFGKAKKSMNFHTDLGFLERKLKYLKN